MRSAALLAWPALLCSALVVAVPAHSQGPLHEAHPHPLATWRSVSDHIIASLFGSSKGPGRASCSGSTNTQPSRPPSPRTLAQYGGDVVLRFNISSTEEAASLAEAADTLLLDVWEFSHNWVDIRLSKDVIPSLLGLLPQTLHASHVPLMRERELAQAIHDTYPTPRDPRRPYEHERIVAAPPHLPERRTFSPALDPGHGAEDNIFFADYQPLSVIEPWMRLLASLFTTHVRMIDIGLSFEGRSIPALRVGVHPTNSEDPDPPQRKTVLVVGSLHAREWISTTTVNYIAYSLITGYGKNPGITSLLEAFDFVFVPTLNPDGYVYTWETDRLWRKTRQRTNIRFCQGIDLDRAFGFEWETQGNPCSESFAGETPFEAIEARRLADWASNETEKNNVEFVGFLDLHSYSQQILYPYSYSCKDPPPGLENLEELAYGLSKAIRMTHKNYYEVLPACEGNVLAPVGTKERHAMPHIEAAGGSALDFFYNTINTRFAYQIKLRDRGTYGFLLPKENIVPTGKEILNAILHFGDFLSDIYVDEVGGVKKPTLNKAVDVEEADIGDADGVVAPESTSPTEDDDWLVVDEVLPEDGEDHIHWGLRRRRR